VSNLSSSLNEEQLAYLQIVMDPVLWCKTHLVDPQEGTPLEPYDYQAEVLRDGSLLRILRMGRRAGKTFILEIFMLWQCHIRKNITCLVIAPYDRQVLEIYEDMIRILEASPYFKKSMGYYTSTKDPMVIRFRNGSRINLMTAGTKAGAEGGAARGQKADWIIFDEMDYLNDRDIDTVIQIRRKNPDKVGVIGASTPSGRRGLFWRYCTDKSIGYKEFHYTFFDTPVFKNASPEKQIELATSAYKECSDELAYKHEVLAEFAEESVGVYAKKSIDRARSYSVLNGEIGKQDRVFLWGYFQKYVEGQFTHEIVGNPGVGVRRTIGVDFDKQGNPTEIVVVEWMPNLTNLSNKKGMFRVIGRFEIPRDEYTYTNAVKTIIELNKVFAPDYIYLDRGPGEMQLELLRKYGVDHPETGLHKKVKAFYFNQKIEVRDPYSGKIDNKDFKPFMVNNSVHIFDSDLIQLSDEDKLLWSQLQDYQVTKVTSTGLPSYSSRNEHCIDALNLALLAMTLEFPELSKLIEPFKPNYAVLGIPRKKDTDLLLSYKEDSEEEDPIELRDQRLKNCHILPSWYTRGSRAKNIVGWAQRGSNTRITPRRKFSRRRF
jgi:hypothetical protein